MTKHPHRLVSLRPRRFVRRVLLFAGGFILTAAVAALAYWMVTVIYGTGNFALAQTSSLSAPTNATAAEASASSLTIGWTVPPSQLPGVKYEVIRNPGGSQVTVCTVSAPTCTDSSLSSGTTYDYSIVAVLDNWQSTAATTSFTTLGVTTSSLSYGITGVPYSTSLAATGGSGTYTNWARKSGTLPTWARLNASTGQITGTPNTEGTTSKLVFTVTDSKGYQATSGSLSLTVGKGASTTSLSLSSSSVAYGKESSVVFTATVAPSGSPTGTISVVNGTTTLCTIKLPAKACSFPNTNAWNTTLVPSATPYSVTATYGGSSSYSASTSSPQYLTVTQGSSTTSLSMSASSVAYGSENKETFTTTVTGAPSGIAPTGTVNIKNGSVSLCTARVLGASKNTSKASCGLTATQLLGGLYSVTATYSGDGNYLASTPTLSLGQTFAVNKAAPTMGLTLVSPTTYGAENNESFGVSVKGSTGGVAPTGTATVYEGSKALCTTSGLAGSSNIGSGSCSLSATELSAGSYTGSSGLKATYNPGGDQNYLTASSSPAESLTVNKDTTTTTVSGSATTVIYGNEGASLFTVTVTTAHHEVVPTTESVTVNVGSSSCAASIVPGASGGSGTCQLGNTALRAGGPYAVTTTYAGGTDLGSSSATVLTGLTVNKAATSFAVAVNGSSSATITTGVRATLAGSGLPAGATGTVTFSSGSTICSFSYPANSSCLTSASLAAKTYQVSATFTDGDGNHNGSVATNTLTLRVIATPTVTFAFSMNGGSYQVGNEGASSWDKKSASACGNEDALCGSSLAGGAPVVAVQISLLGTNGKYWDGTFTSGHANFIQSTQKWITVAAGSGMWLQAWSNNTFNNATGCYTVQARAEDNLGNLSPVIGATFTVTSGSSNK
jgi:hypothetical protein